MRSRETKTEEKKPIEWLIAEAAKQTIGVNSARTSSKWKLQL